MDEPSYTAPSQLPQDDAAGRLSYKFQRLRERIRAAIASGELTGKLPGERQLAKRFHVNAKTLSKALTDLAAEGVLDRSIGRGTFVKGADGAASTQSQERWLVICDQEQTNGGLIEHLKQINPNLQVVTETKSLRPSFLNPIKAVIDLSQNTPDTFLRDLIVRNIAVVLVGREPSTYSVNAVLVDRVLGASYLARQMMLSGHRRFVAVERRGQMQIAEAIRNAAKRYAPDATVDSIHPTDVPFAIEQHQVSAIICDTRRLAEQVKQILASRGFAIPGQVSLAAIGSGAGDYPCSGYFLDARQKAQAVADILRDNQARRPTTLWMTGAMLDRGSISAPQTHVIQDESAAAEMVRPPMPQFVAPRA